MKNPLTWLAALGLLSASACMSSMSHKPLNVASQTPAAQGKIGVEKTDQGNMKLDVDVQHLAPPDKVASGTNVYVVWAQPPEGKGQPQNLGALKVGNDLSGSLQTKTAARRVKITLTPEPDASAHQPTHDPVMWATVNPWK